jgi:hypothetical protein
MLLVRVDYWQLYKHAKGGGEYIYIYIYTWTKQSWKWSLSNPAAMVGSFLK